MARLEDNLATLRSRRGRSTERHRDRLSEIVELANALKTAQETPLPGLGPDLNIPKFSAPSGVTSSGGAKGGSLLAALNRLIADAKKQGHGVTIKSHIRSTERQAQLWADALKKHGSPEKARKWVAPPGRSNHEKGLAADLGFSSPAAKAWIHEVAPKYGLNFPLSNEPWHIEPMGIRRR